MIKDCAVQLDSYRLAQYAVQVPCYICDQGNTFDAELCRHCFAPMALAHQANTQKLFPTMLATIGSSGVGKTVFRGILHQHATSHHDRAGSRRISRQDAQRARPLELGALPGAGQ